MANEVKEPALKFNYTNPAEYLLAERAAEEKHEYYDGQVLATGGAGLNHNRIQANLLMNIGLYLKGKNCSILLGDVRVCTPTQDAYM